MSDTDKDAKKAKKKKLHGEPLLPKNTDGRNKPVAGQLRLYDYKDEEVLEILFQAGGVVTHAARMIGCTPKTLRTRLHKIPDGIDRLNNEFRAHALELAQKSILHHLELMDKDVTKYVMSALGGHLGFAHRQQIHLLEEHKQSIEISDNAVDVLKQRLQSSIETIEIAEEIDDDAT